MQNIGVQIAKIERNLQQLSRSISKEVPDYIAAALYLGSSDQKDNVFALVHAGGDDAHQARADKRIWRRLLSPNMSAAAESFTAQKPTITKSLMFPDEHLCSHTPFQGANGTSGVLQTIFHTRAHLDRSSEALNRINGAALKRVSASLNSLLSMSSDLDRDLNVRAPYAPDAVVMFCDISGFSHAGANAHYRAQDFADKFCKDFILESAPRFKAELLRMEGDGVWLSFPFDPTNALDKKNAARNAADMAHYVTNNYGQFTKATDQKFQGTHIKVIAEIGELRKISWAADCSGPVFIQITKNLPHAERHKNSIMIGPELSQEMPETYMIAKNMGPEFARLTL